MKLMRPFYVLLFVTGVTEMLGSAALDAGTGTARSGDNGGGRQDEGFEEQGNLPPPFWVLWGLPRDRFILGVHSYSWSGSGAV